MKQNEQTPIIQRSMFSWVLEGNGKLQALLLLVIAIGAFIPAVTDSLNRFGSTEWFQLGKLFSVLFLLAGFLVSTEIISEIRVPFTHKVLWARRTEAREATES